MATLAETRLTPAADDTRFFMFAAFGMAFTVAAGFSLQLAMGRSSFAAPPLVHAHALVFMGWVTLYVLQNVFAAKGNSDIFLSSFINAQWPAADRCPSSSDRCIFSSLIPSP